MNNYNRYYDREEPPNYHQYNLWQNSHFNNGFNLQYEFYDASFHRSSDGSTPNSHKSEEIADFSDHKNRRVVPRQSLFMDPELFYIQENGAEEHHVHQNGIHYPTGYDWTQQNWLKAGEGEGEGPREPAQGPSGARAAPRPAGRLQERLAEAMARPVEMNKAESMMQKMGWQGGALGKSGDGIVEPIAPNAAYASSTIGFGQTQERPKTKKLPKQPKQENNKEFFNTNVLLNILEFVKNESEVELLFDQKLNNHERKAIHSLVGYIGDSEEMMNMDSVAQMDIVGEINRCNRYVLGSQSEGEKSERRLCIYKEAPEHVYLITPDDLKDDPPDETIDKPDTTDKKSMDTDDKSMEIQDEETNPFLRSITRNLKSEPKENLDENISNKFEECNLGQKLDLTGKIIKFFLEFLELDVFTEFRFLGPFEGGEIERVNDFVGNVTEFLSKGVCSEVYERVVEGMKRGDYGFNVREDCNDSVVIYKFKKDAKKS